jgi:hypothetical protein
VTKIVLCSLVVLSLAVGCGGGGGGAAGTGNGSEASLGALLVGQLYGDASRRCIWVGGKHGGAQVAWPARYRLRFDPIRIEDANGRVLAHAGDWVRLGGGFDPGTKPDPGCPHGGQNAKWLPGRIQFLGKKRPPDAIRKP